jgi:uncharacterized RDD family membrane protein YckC
MTAYAYPGPQVAADPTAVVGRRIGAFFIDAAVMIVAVVIIFIPLATKRTVNETLGLPGCHRKPDDATQIECDNRQVFRVGDNVYEAGGGSFALDVAFAYLYFALLPGLAGATLGKLLTGIRVVNSSGRTPGIGRSSLRWLVFAVDGPFSLYLCGLLTFLLSKGHRRLGDMAAGTYVIGAASVGQPVTIAAPVPHIGIPQMGAPPIGAPPAGGPQWDAIRGEYVQWDPATGRYLTWDQTTQTWR